MAKGFGFVLQRAGRARIVLWRWHSLPEETDFQNQNKYLFLIFFFDIPLINIIAV